MLRAPTIAIAMLAGSAQAQDIDLTPLIASEGLSGAITALQADPPRPARDFALGGAMFLRGIEKTMQLRYRHNADFGDLDMPVLRLPLPNNTEAQPFYPGLVRDLFADLVDDMIKARGPLADATGAFGVTLDLTRVWFDVNENGQQDAGEDLMRAAGAALGGIPAAQSDGLVVRFDGADAAWLMAYTHLIESVAHFVLAFDPTDVIAEVNESVARMEALRGPDTPNTTFLFDGEEDIADNIAVVYGALNRQPDADHTRAMRQSLLSLVTEERRFWTLVAMEEDDDREWIPKTGQTSALGIALPEETGDVWRAILADAEDVLTGRKLIGHWRLDGKGGVNVAKLLDDPVPVDAVTWVHGHGLTDYIERGPLADDRNINAFLQMFQGDALLFMVWLN